MKNHRSGRWRSVVESDTFSITITLNPMLRIALAIALLISTLSVSQAQSRRQQIFQLTTGLTSTTVPFELINNLIIVPVVVDGSRTLNFILDNGTKNPVIFSKAYVRGMNLELGPTVRFRGVGSKRMIQGKVVKGVSLHLSGAATDLIGMVILDRNPLGQLSMKGKTIHGVLGSTLFRCFAVEIDYVRQELHLHDQTSFVADGSYEPMAMTVLESKPFIRATVKKGKNSIHSNFMIDTGFNNKLVLLLPEYIDRQSFAKRGRRRVGIGYGGDIYTHIGRVDTVLIGSLTLDNLYTIIPTSKNVNLHQDISDFPRQGTLGNAAFAHTSIIFDYPANTFYVKRPELLESEGEVL